MTAANSRSPRCSAAARAQSWKSRFAEIVAMDSSHEINHDLSNLSKNPLTAKFESFVLVDDKSTLAESFAD